MSFSNISINFIAILLIFADVLFVFNRIKNKSHNKNKIMLFMRYKNCYLFDILEKLRNNSYSFSNYHG